MPKSFRGATDLLYQYAKHGEARTLHTAQKSFMFFLSITLLNGRVCANDFNIKAFEYGRAFDIVGEGEVSSCACAFNLRWLHHRMLKLKMR